MLARLPEPAGQVPAVTLGSRTSIAPTPDDQAPLAQACTTRASPHARARGGHHSPHLALDGGVTVPQPGPRTPSPHSYQEEPCVPVPGGQMSPQHRNTDAAAHSSVSGTRTAEARELCQGCAGSGRLSSPRRLRRPNSSSHFSCWWP